MMKKLVSLLIALLMIISVTAGAEENGSAANEAEIVQTEEVQAGAAPEAEQPESTEPEGTEAPAENGTADEAEEGEAPETSETADVPEGEASETVEGTDVSEDEAPETVERADVSEDGAPETVEGADVPEGEEVSELKDETEQAAEPEDTETAEPTEIAENTEPTGETSETEVPETATEEAQEAEPTAETETVPAANADAAAKTETEAAPATEAESVPVAEAEATPAAEPETVPVAEAETTPIAEPATEPASEMGMTAEPELPAAAPQEAAGEPATETETATEQELPAAASQEAEEEPEADVLSATAYIEAPDAPADVLTAADSVADILPTSNYASENNIRGFVYRLYSTVFQRTPDEEGFRYWVNKLETGEDTAADVVTFFFNSPEYQRSGKNNSQIVTDCYSTMLNRTPDEEGYEYWKQRLDVGMTPQVVLCGFIYSPEFAGIVAQYGVVRGDMAVTNPRDKNYERTYFVYRLYQNCLSRGADLTGEEYWCEQLDKGMSGAEVASGFFFSEEFNKNRYNNSTFVQLLYKAIQGREYDTDGLVHWTTRLNLYDTREKVLNGFIESPEFRAQCRTAQINPGAPLYTPDDTFEWQYNIKVLWLCNVERQKAGLANLYTREDLLWDLAIQRAQETTEVFAHTRPDGTDCFTLFKEQGFYGHLGENLAAGTVYSDAYEVVEAWMNSEGHRKNILNPDFTYLATGYVYDPTAYSYCADGKYKGQYINFGSYAAQSFCNYGFKIN